MLLIFTCVSCHNPTIACCLPVKQYLGTKYACCDGMIFQIGQSLFYREGILFSLSKPDEAGDRGGPPPYLTFLEILSEFTNKLMKPDRRVV